MRKHGWLLAVAVLFAAGAGWFAANTPYRQPGVLFLQKDPETGGPQAVPDVGAPDERQHANYTARLLAGQGLPVLVPGDFEGYQAHQPPLYYVLAAGFSRAVGADPQSRETGGRLRYFNVLVGLATLAGVYLGARWAGADRAQAATAGALLLLPMNLALHGAVSNDPLFYCLLAWSMAWMVRMAVHGWSLAGALVLGGLMGLGMLAKTPALGALPLAVLAHFLSPKERRCPSWLFTSLGLALVLVAPWWARNVSLYGDPLAAGAFERAFVGSPAAATFVQAYGAYAYWANWVAWWASRSLVGVFGYMDIFLLEWRGAKASAAVYSASLLLLALPFLGWARSGKEAGLDRRAAWLALGLTSVVLLFFVRFNSVYFQGQARYLFPALPGIAWLWAAGLRRLAPRPCIAYGAALALMLALFALSAATVVQGFPPRLPAGPE